MSRQQTGHEPGSARKDPGNRSTETFPNPKTAFKRGRLNFGMITMAHTPLDWAPPRKFLATLGVKEENGNSVPEDLFSAR